MKLKDALAYSEKWLNDACVDEAQFKALCLVCNLAGIKDSQFHFKSEAEIDSDELNAQLQRLMDGEPLQYIIGKWDFYESEFFVGEGVLIPRPETEELVQLAIDYAKKLENPIIYDLCSGSGCIGLSVAKKIDSSTVYCVEKSEQAFCYLEKNAKGIPNAKLILSDICDMPEMPEADIIISNPPYIRTEDIKSLDKELFYEPRMALDGGNDGLYFYRIIRDEYLEKLKDNGVLLLEIGNEQGRDIKALFKNAKIIKDIYGNERIAEIIKD